MKIRPVFADSVTFLAVCFIRELYHFTGQCVYSYCYVYTSSLQEFENKKQVELELLEVKLAQKSIAVAQERENNMAERQCVSITITCAVFNPAMPDFFSYTTGIEDCLWYNLTS